MFIVTSIYPLYIFIFLHQTTTPLCIHLILTGCISLYSYIKPQPACHHAVVSAGCISLYSYIKPQRRCALQCRSIGCISLYSYIKPQLIELLFNLSYVVYLYIPTSNHNKLSKKYQKQLVVYLYIPTSNHNLRVLSPSFTGLYIFIFLHQTTTCSGYAKSNICCISLYSYIKPQRTASY